MLAEISILRLALLVVHGLAAVVWIGGMIFVSAVALPAARGIDNPAAHMPLLGRMIRRFRAIAAGAAALLFATGLGLIPSVGLDAGWRLALFLVMAVSWGLLAAVVASARPPGDGQDEDPERVRERLRSAIVVHWVLTAIAVVALGAGLVLGAT